MDHAVRVLIDAEALVYIKDTFLLLGCLTFARRVFSFLGLLPVDVP